MRACVCACAFQAGKWFTIPSVIKLRLLLAVAATRRCDASAPNRAALDAAFQVKILKSLLVARLTI